MVCRCGAASGLGAVMLDLSMTGPLDHVATFARMADAACAELKVFYLAARLLETQYYYWKLSSTIRKLRTVMCVLATL